MISVLLSRVISLGLGTLYPAYASYKAVKTKNVKEYVKWMTYWIVFALFTSIETFVDFFFSFWFPFYYEIKIVFLIWLLSPVTKGSLYLYRKVVHPALLCREEKIDKLIKAAQNRSYITAIELCQKGMSYFSGWALQMAITAPGMMTEIMNGFGQRSEQPTSIISEVENTADNLRPGVTGIDMSDDEMDKQTSIPTQDEMTQSKSDSDEVKSTTKEVTNSKWKTSNLYFSSDAESDNPDFQPLAKETKSRETVRRKTTRKSSRKPKQEHK